MTQKTMTKEFIGKMRQEIEEALAKICEKNGLKRVSIGNIRYSATSFSTAKLEFAFKSQEQASGVAPKPESFINRRFKIRQTVLTITRADGDSAVIGVTQRGKSYRVKIDQLLGMIEVK
jgi:hypothetical protein